MEKKCLICGKKKPLDDYHQNKRGYYNSYCKKCCNARVRNRTEYMHIRYLEGKVK